MQHPKAAKQQVWKPYPLFTPGTLSEQVFNDSLMATKGCIIQRCGIPGVKLMDWCCFDLNLARTVKPTSGQTTSRLTDAPS